MGEGDIFAEDGKDIPLAAPCLPLLVCLDPFLVFLVQVPAIARALARLGCISITTSPTAGS
jgi:hypothetical protein